MSKNRYTCAGKQAYACFASTCKVIAIQKLHCPWEQCQAGAAISWVHVAGKGQVGVLWNTARKLEHIAVDQIRLEAQGKCITNTFSGVPHKMQLGPAPTACPWKVCSSIPRVGRGVPAAEASARPCPKTLPPYSWGICCELVTTAWKCEWKISEVNKRKIQIL